MTTQKNAVLYKLRKCLLTNAFCTAITAVFFFRLTPAMQREEEWIVLGRSGCITGASRDALLNELHALAETRFGNDARKLRHTLAADGSIRVVCLPIREFLALLRALDHIVNTRSAPRPLRRLRALVSAAGIVYTVRPLGGRDVTLSSHSRPYIEGDRIVTECGHAMRVDHVEETDEPTRLLCSE